MNTLRRTERVEGATAGLHHRLLTGLARLSPGRRGLRKLTLALGLAFDRNNAVILAHEAGFLFRVRLGDPYWTRLLFADYRYEPEVELCLSALLNRDRAFLDCGANTGYWCGYAATLTDEVIAVEASAVTFAELERNAALAGAPVQLVRKAVWRKSGEELQFVRDSRRHGAAHISGLWSDREGTYRGRHEPVLTTTLDEACATRRPVVVKLDVEGAEIEALSGAQRLLEGDSVFIYEDHGNDPECGSSRGFLERGCHVFSFEARPRRMASAAEVASIKTRPDQGYNFVACRPASAFYQDVQDLCEHGGRGVEPR